MDLKWSRLIILNKNQSWGGKQELNQYRKLVLTGIPRWQRMHLPGQETQEMQVDPSVGKIPWRRKWQPTPVFLPGESHGWRSLLGFSPWYCKKSDPTEHIVPTIKMHIYIYKMHMYNITAIKTETALCGKIQKKKKTVFNNPSKLTS